VPRCCAALRPLNRVEAPQQWPVPKASCQPLLFFATASVHSVISGVWKRTAWKHQLAFVSPLIANGVYVLVAVLWFVPDRRIERVLARREH